MLCHAFLAVAIWDLNRVQSSESKASVGRDSEN